MYEIVKDRAWLQSRERKQFIKDLVEIDVVGDLLEPSSAFAALSEKLELSQVF